MKFFQLALALLFSQSMIYPAAAQDKKLTTLNVGYSAISGSFAPLWVGYDHGLFAKHGLELKMAYIQGNRVMLSALTAGEIDLYQGGAEGLIRLVSGGGDGVFIATQYNVRRPLRFDDRPEHRPPRRSAR
jgi:ABC-type nitrate/sulfonate/bicarbonate transport system substrate-binding protein